MSEVPEAIEYESADDFVAVPPPEPAALSWQPTRSVTKVFSNESASSDGGAPSITLSSSATVQGVGVEGEGEGLRPHELESFQVDLERKLLHTMAVQIEVRGSNLPCCC